MNSHLWLHITEEGWMIREWYVEQEHGQEIFPKPKHLVTAKAYLSAVVGPIISDFFDFCIHWVSVVRVT